MIPKLLRPAVNQIKMQLRGVTSTFL